MGSNIADRHPHLQPLARQNFWFSLTLHEVESQLGDMGKPLGRMNLDELLQNVWTAEANQSNMLDTDSSSSSSSLQRQASFSLAKAFSGKTVDNVWRDIQQGQKRKSAEEMRVHGVEATLGEITLEDFLVKAGRYAEFSSGPVEGASPTIDRPSDMGSSSQKRDIADAIEKILDRRLSRKIKNRESAARSRVRKQARFNYSFFPFSPKREVLRSSFLFLPFLFVSIIILISISPQSWYINLYTQAYHNELVGKVSRLEEENGKLKKEKARITILHYC